MILCWPEIQYLGAGFSLPSWHFSLILLILYFCTSYARLSLNRLLIFIYLFFGGYLFQLCIFFMTCALLFHRFQICLMFFTVNFDLFLWADLNQSTTFTNDGRFFWSSFFKNLYWSIIVLQWCVSFCCITKCISYTYIPISPPSCVSLPPSLSHPSRWTQSTKLISLCYAGASH